jgi:hypothetical protein
MYYRYGYKWTIPEILQLQREYELLKMPTEEIALLHKRSENAIIFKVEKEGFRHDEDNNRVYGISPNLGSIMTMTIVGICLFSLYISVYSLNDIYPM